MATHIAYIRLMPVDATGAIINKNQSISTVSAQTDTKPIVLANATYAPNATGSQTIEEYITAEDGAGFRVVHMDNTMIVTTDL
jgi:hypothetical protein